MFAQKRVSTKKKKAPAAVAVLNTKRKPLSRIEPLFFIFEKKITINIKNKGLEMKNKYIWIKVLLQIKVQSGGQGARKPALRNSFSMEL